MVTKLGPTFPQAEGMSGPTSQNKRYHKEGGRAVLAAASDSDEADGLNFSFLAYAFKRARLAC